MRDGDRGRHRAGRKAGRQFWWRFRQRTDTREEDDEQSPRWSRRREEGLQTSGGRPMAAEQVEVETESR